MELRNAVGILTGASRGIGSVLAERLARAGVHLALAARTEEGLADTAERVRSLGVRATAVPTDVTRRQDLENLVRRAEEELGPVDLLVNNAGVEWYRHFESIDPDLVEATIRTNLLGALLLTRFALPGMVERGRGHIVNISSAAGKTAVPYNATYASTKHALVGFSWSLREEMRSYGIGVSVVCPGFVTETGMAQSWLRGRKPPRVAGLVSPQQVADAVVKVIEKNRAEAVVSGGLGKIADLAMAVSPDLSMKIGRRGGLYDFLRQEAGES